LPPIISAQSLSKRFGTAPLFQNISFKVSEGDRIGIIGPNGSGKSTLLEIINGNVRPDTGDVAIRKNTRIAAVRQISEFPAGQSIRTVIEKSLERSKVPESERAARFAETLGRAGFADLDAQASALSGGWRKRLAIAEGLVQGADVLLLDEPTNHLDLAGIDWLEALLLRASFACVIVSHDRYFLENVTNEMVELDKVYEDGFLRVSGNYSAFLEAKENYLHAQRKQQDSLANRVHTEMEWLRRGPKARTTKAKARIDKAHELIGDLAELRARSSTTSAQIDFSATSRKTKQLAELTNLSCDIGGRTLFRDLDFTITSGMRVGLVGPNGSGKTTLLRLLRGDIEPTAGTIRKAAPLKIVYFDQSREIDPDISLRRALAPDSDSVIFQDRVIHVAAWAARFLFDGEALNQKVGRLSGGERARVLIAQLMLQSADILLLDEPTNDLDIPTLEILEESLLDYAGALVLVTHDRFMLDRVSTIVLGLDGIGGVERFADYSQWDAWQKSQLKQDSDGTEKTAARLPGPADRAQPPGGRKKLSYNEAREYAVMEERIATAERNLAAKHTSLDDAEVTSDHLRLQAALAELAEAQTVVDGLYARWAELEQKQN